MDAREDSSTLITIINDENKINEKDIVAFESYAIKPILFSSIGENENRMCIYFSFFQLLKNLWYNIFHVYRKM